MTRTRTPPGRTRGLPGFDNATEVIVEVLHGEGGDDSKGFATELGDVYRRYAQAKGLRVELLDEGEGHVVLKVTGAGAGRALAGEEGKHCVQRIPENDRSGRRQTSFVNVAVLPLPPEGRFEPLPERELQIKAQTGKRGPGGQNKNKVASAIRMKHVPTGLSVFIDGRDQGRNKQEALRILTVKVNNLRNGNVREEYVATKGAQLGDRGRGGKVRTYNFLQSRVTDHRTGRETKDVKAVMKGQLELVR